ncbi:hypothetical protein Gohar_007672 [Gossypium harknessii]|uniref:TRF2/HOY1 PH-like domain-containing protein n=1 Tax=Gossypium harknessii TaxID=34285 RepID=A0A7J9GH96_9ROSI|nr:hypothetical protein [Gossypium harknessii]
MESGVFVPDDNMNIPMNFDFLFGSCSQSTPQVNSYDQEALQMLPVLGLKLSKTPDFLEKLQKLTQQQLQNSNVRQQPNSNVERGSISATPKSKDVFLQTINKIKAENFPISLLKIGSWQRVSRNEGDLVGKCYFSKKKLVWEFLENGLKSKIEIQWTDITSMKVSMPENQPAVLEIELNQPPTFHHEIDPQPRKHTQWRLVPDFTGGQALTYRRHHLRCPPGLLNKPLEKLLNSDSRLLQLIQQGFPTKSPYFKYSLDFGGKGYINFEHQQQQKQPFSFISNMNDSHSHSPLPVWDQWMSSTDQICNQIQMPLWGQEAMNDQLAGLQTLNDHQNMSLVDFDDGIDMVYKNEQNVTDNNVVAMSNDCSSCTGGGSFSYPQANNWPLQFQILEENMNMANGNNLYLSANSEPTMRYFSNSQ